MTPTIISMLVFLGVSAVIGLLAFVFREQGPQTSTRSTCSSARQPQGPADQRHPPQDRLRERQEVLLEAITPKFLSPQKLFEQADCNIKPGTLTGIGLLLAALGGRRSRCWRSCRSGSPRSTAALLMGLPFLWLYMKRPTG